MSSDTPLLDASARQKVARAELAKRFLIVLIAVLVTVNQFTMLAILDEIRSTQKVGSPTLKAIAEQQDDIEAAVESAESGAQAAEQLLDLVLDCVDPEGECAKESAAHEAEQAGADVAANVYSIYCHFREMPENYTPEQLLTCVGRHLDQDRGDQR